MNGKVNSRILYEYGKYPKDVSVPITFALHMESYIEDQKRLNDEELLRTSSFLPKHQIVFVLDTSSSMKTNIKMLKQIMQKVILLSRGNTIGIVTFNSIVDILCPMTLLKTDEDIETMQAKVTKLFTHGYTNLCDGIVTGMDVLWSDQSNEKKLPESTQLLRRFMILLTDGETNCGCVKEDQIQTEMEDCPYINFTDIYAIALGNDVNQDLLQNLTTSYNGKLYSVATNQQLWASFGDCMGSIMSSLIRDLTITISSLCQVTTDYPNVSFDPDDKKTIVINVGTLFINDNRDILVSLKNIPTDIISSSLAIVKIMYVDELTQKTHVGIYDVIPNFADVAIPQDLNPEIRKQNMRIEVSKLTAQWSSQSQERMHQILLEIEANHWQNDLLCSEIITAIKITPSLPPIARRGISIEFATQRQFTNGTSNVIQRIHSDTFETEATSIANSTPPQTISDFTIFTQLSQDSSITSKEAPDDSTISQSSFLKRTSSQSGLSE
jgi:Mg-chelatase subunit ChlD